MVQAVWLEQENKQTRATLRDVDPAELGPGDTRVRVHWSGLNYKDGLAITGRAPVIRQFPRIPGIDLAGTIEHTTAEGWRAGDTVLLTGFGYGETRHGGLSESARVDAQHLVRLPANLEPREAMILGTAGFTAMLAVQALADHVAPSPQSDVVVTGANGGVGSIAIALLARMGYRVTAATGRLSQATRLEQLGAHSVIDRAELNGDLKPLLAERWHGAIDTVGSRTLANLCASVRYGGAIAACGMAQGLDLPSSVAPFILRGVSLRGIDSVQVPAATRPAIWQALADIVDSELLASLATEVPLSEVIDSAHDLLDGRIVGRRIVRMARQG